MCLLIMTDCLLTSLMRASILAALKNPYGNQNHNLFDGHPALFIINIIIVNMIVIITITIIIIKISEESFTDLQMDWPLSSFQHS